MTADLAGQVRAICLALPEVAERLSHGAPTWFVSKKAFVTLWAEGHHGDEFPHLWCAGHWTEIAELCQDAYRAIAPARLASLLDG